MKQPKFQTLQTSSKEDTLVQSIFFSNELEKESDKQQISSSSECSNFFITKPIEKNFLMQSQKSFNINLNKGINDFASLFEDMQIKCQESPQFNPISICETISCVYSKFIPDKSPKYITQNQFEIEIKCFGNSTFQKKYIIDEKGAIIGSSSDSNINIDNDQKEQQDYIQIQKNQEEQVFYVSDLGNDQGSYIMANNPIQIQQDNILQLGINEFKVNIDSIENEILLSLSNKDSQYQIVFNRKEKLRNSIGRLPFVNTIVIDDPQLSNIHAIFYCNDFDQVIMEDYNSSNGSWIKLKYQEEIPLQINSILNLGNKYQVKIIEDTIKEFCCNSTLLNRNSIEELVTFDSCDDKICVQCFEKSQQLPFNQKICPICKNPYSQYFYLYY